MYIYIYVYDPLCSLNVVSYCLGDTFVFVPCCFLVYGKYLPFCPLFLFFNFTPPFPESRFPLPQSPFSLWGLSINQLFVFFNFLVGYYYLLLSIMIMIILSVLALPCVLSYFCLGSSLAPCRWLLFAGSCEGFVHLTLPVLVDLVCHTLRPTCKIVRKCVA
jgi:hypothetical protein